MAKRSIVGYAPKGVQLNKRWYGQEHIDQIIKVAGGLPAGQVKIKLGKADGSKLETATVDRREALSVRLQSAAQVYSVFSEAQQKPTPRQLKLQYARIQTAAERLLDALGAGCKGDINQMPYSLRHEFLRLARLSAMATGYGPLYTTIAQTQLRSTIKGVASMKCWARSLKKSASEACAARSKSARARKRDEALAALVDSLVAIWVEVFNRQAATSNSRKTGQADGALVNFIRACFKPLEIKTTSNGIRERILDCATYKKHHAARRMGKSKKTGT